eukprot:TRINITY_DN10250_c0_g1_i1.p1 TRINITY_DN10250_c0_g1~~TRINITY_DN10250_c0_g1_i1.p1  ORF type:complete len:443 (-),score=69.04 TRINITY_DN10250_c0_g1_i1:71-1399(-)
MNGTLWNIQFLVIIIKLCSTLTKTLVPLSIIEHSEQDKHFHTVAHQLEEEYIESYESSFLLILILSVTYNYFHPKHPSKTTGAIAVLSQIFSSIGLVFLSHNPDYFAWTVPKRDFAFLHFVQLFSTFLLSNYVTSWSISSSVPTSGLKLSATILVSLLHVFILFFPVLSSTAFLLSFSLVLDVILLSLFLSISSESDKSSGSKHNEKEEPHFHASDNVSIFTALLFIGVSVVGLNGEQLLDAMMNVKIRDDHFAGKKDSAIAKQAITLASSLLALLSTFHLFGTGKGKKSEKSRFSSSVMILIWGLAQVVRVFYFSDNFSSNTFTSIVGLILLDKYTGNLGEIAFEKGLLNFLQKKKIVSHNFTFKIPMIWLMTVHTFIEDFTQTLGKTLVRHSRKATADSGLYFLFWQWRGAVVVLLVLMSVFFVLSVNRSKTEKVKDKRQ